MEGFLRAHPDHYQTYREANGDHLRQKARARRWGPHPGIVAAAEAVYQLKQEIKRHA